MSDPRSKYALAIQGFAKSEIASLKENPVVMGGEWAFPLEAAPAAVCTMAILLKTASKTELAGIEVTSQEVTGHEGKTLGTLPAKLFHANLEHCSQLGQSSFREAEKTMALIERTAHDMTRDDGSISYIIELLEDLDEAQTELRPEVEKIEETSRQCLEDIRTLCSKFEYWYWVICSLKTRALEGKDNAQLEKNQRDIEQKLTRKERVTRGEEESLAKQMAEEAETRLRDAKIEIERARKEVDKLAGQDSGTELSYAQEIEEAEKAIAAMEPPKKEGGARALVKKVKVGMFGENQKEYEARVKKFEDLKRKRDEYIADERARREQARQRAEDALRVAKEEEEKIRDEIAKARAELIEKKDQHLEARNSWTRATSELKRLGEEKIELKTILRILESSINQLATLKNQVNQLVKFFDLVLVEVTKGVARHVTDFLDPVKRCADQGRLGNIAKKRIITQSLHIQSSFSTIRDISGTFVKISNKYIGPAIDQMEALAAVPDKHWDSESERFTQVCHTYMQEIREMAENAATNMHVNVKNRIDYLGQHAIDVAAAA
ncbi:hypothetical protein QBC38DRAFT_398050 [Podospora fimiseda]|uniref:Uncharacterized protein n=1 Tax=Podospora fimiseda TaxID=252190 RepID=A0AAN7BJ70_9PEZI|nr:hypothetical protein QBC38DRAFT_398050 [Podospora fimiseda]